MLRALQSVNESPLKVAVYDRIAELPIFSPDREGSSTPKPVTEFTKAIDQADGLIFASPEYVRSIPGGLKNAIDWMVSGNMSMRAGCPCLESRNN
jgi:NAD(P)H-dependent FMN reductase